MRLFSFGSPHGQICERESLLVPPHFTGTSCCSSIHFKNISAPERQNGSGSTRRRIDLKELREVLSHDRGMRSFYNQYVIIAFLRVHGWIKCITRQGKCGRVDCYRRSLAWFQFITYQPAEIKVLKPQRSFAQI